jgi:hypothetical protein
MVLIDVMWDNNSVIQRELAKNNQCAHRKCEFGVILLVSFFEKFESRPQGVWIKKRYASWETVHAKTIFPLSFSKILRVVPYSLLFP